MAVTESERRQYKRLDAKVDVELTQFDQARGKEITRDTESQNVSVGGLLISSDWPLEISSYVRARFVLGEDVQKDIVAKVVRVDEVEPLSRYDIGLQFVETLLEEEVAVLQ
jgi:c-di-GMP-binding flagellar brake protein YcgR